MAKTNRNPLIAESGMPIDTIGNCGAVLDFLHWVESGDFGSNCGESGAVGRQLILQAVKSAVWSLEPHLRREVHHA